MDPSKATAPAVARGTLRSTSPEHTLAIGRAIGARAAAGTVISLIGELGAGKTQLTKGIAEGLGVPTMVNSPTFVLMNEHVGRLRLHHVDAYRLDDPADAIAAGLLDERQAAGIVVIEWADRLEGWLSVERLDIKLEADATDQSAREIGWVAHGADHERLATAALVAA